MATPIQEAEKLISSGNTEKALQLLVKGTSGRFKRKFALLLNRLKRINKQYTQGTLSDNNFQTESNKVSRDLLVALQQYEAHLNGESVGTSPDTIKWAIVGILVFIVGFLGVRYWWQESKELVLQSLEIQCNQNQQIVYVANAENLDARYDNDNVLFSKTLKGKVERGVSKKYYVQGLTEDYNFTNRDRVEELFSNDTCVVKGIYINATYVPDKEVCQIYIDIVNLNLDNPSLTGENRIILDNPPNVQFEINPDAELITNFILALTNLYDTNLDLSLDLFNRIEQTLDLSSKPQLEAFIKMSKGNAYLLSGQKNNAIKEYFEIKSFEKYLPLIKSNIEKFGLSNLLNSDGLLFSQDKILFYKKMKDGKNWLINNLNIETKNSWCFDNEKRNCDEFGRLYNWHESKITCNELGIDWRLPNDTDWDNLMKSYGSNSKSAYKALVLDGNSGFSGQFGGNRAAEGSFYGLNLSGYYWSSTETKLSNASNYNFFKDQKNIFRYDSDKLNGRSVRCVQNIKN